MTEPIQVTDQAAVLLAPNPGPMTLDGTNSYVIGAVARAAGRVVVDPGPDDTAHLGALAAAGEVRLILITHQHPDHTEGAGRLHAMTGAPVRAPREADCIGAPLLRPGETIREAGCQIVVIATPGHTADSVCFHLVEDDGGAGSLLTGDSVLGAGTTVIGIPDGTLAQYVDSLQRIADLGVLRGLPAHGPQIDNLPALCEQYLAHRSGRLSQVRSALARLGIGPLADAVGAVTDAVYGDVDPAVRFAAEHSVAAQLEYLRSLDAPRQR